MGEDYYEILKSWIAGGAKLKFDSPRVTGIELSPKNPVVQKIGDKQQMRVIATYANGEERTSPPSRSSRPATPTSPRLTKAVW